MGLARPRRAWLPGGASKPLKPLKLKAFVHFDGFVGLMLPQAGGASKPTKQLQLKAFVNVDGFVGFDAPPGRGGALKPTKPLKRLKPLKFNGPGQAQKSLAAWGSIKTIKTIKIEGFCEF